MLRSVIALVSILVFLTTTVLLVFVIPTVDYIIARKILLAKPRGFEIVESMELTMLQRLVIVNCFRRITTVTAALLFAIWVIVGQVALAYGEAVWPETRQSGWGFN